MSKTLLAIDDSATMRKAYEITFAGDEFTVVTASDGKTGLEKASGASPAAVLVDGTLGNEDAYTIAKELRAKHPKAAILVMSNKANAYDASKGKDSGVDDFADKPFDTQQLLDKVRKAILAKDGVAAPASVKTTTAAPPAAAAAAPPPASTSTAAAKPARSKTLVFGPEMVGVGEPAKPAAATPAATPAPAAAAPVAATAAKAAPAAVDVSGRLASLGLTKDQMEGVLSLSKEIVERAVWEIVPRLAETMIKEEIERLTK